MSFSIFFPQTNVAARFESPKGLFSAVYPKRPDDEAEEDDGNTPAWPEPPAFAVEAEESVVVGLPAREAAGNDDEDVDEEEDREEVLEDAREELLRLRRLRFLSRLSSRRSRLSRRSS